MEVPQRRLAERAPDSTPHQGVGGEPAVGGEPPMAVNPAVGVTIPPWDPEYSKNDVAALRNSPLWWDLLRWVKEKCLRVPSRRALSAHTTTACQPKKAVGPSASSLKACGLDTFLSKVDGTPSPAVGGAPRVFGGMYLCVELPHAFVYGDGLGVRYLSEGSGLLTR